MLLAAEYLLQVYLEQMLSRLPTRIRPPNRCQRFRLVKVSTSLDLVFFFFLNLEFVPEYGNTFVNGVQTQIATNSSLGTSSVQPTSHTLPLGNGPPPTGEYASQGISRILLLFQTI